MTVDPAEPITDPYRQQMLDLAKRQVVAQERTASYLGTMLLIAVVLIVVGFVAAAIAFNH